MILSRFNSNNAINGYKLYRGTLSEVIFDQFEASLSRSDVGNVKQLRLSVTLQYTAKWLSTILILELNETEKIKFDKFK